MRKRWVPVGVSIDSASVGCGVVAAGCCARAADDDDDDVGHSAVLGGGPSWTRSPMYAPMSVNMIPMPLMMT